jgi:hypothetical protein
LREGSYRKLERFARTAAKDANHRQRLLRVCGERPSRCRAAENNEVASPHDQPSSKGADYHIVK